MHRHTFLRLSALTLASALLLAGCGGGGSGATDSDDHVGERIDSAGRLAVLQADSASVRIWDLDSAQQAGSFTLDHPPATVYASPGGRYAIALQRTQDQAQFIDGGLWQEDHGDHLHDYRQAPRLLSLRMPAVRPTHFETHGTQAALFNDGLAAENKNAEVVLLSDAGIGKGTVDARLPLPLPMHGTAEPLGDHLLTTYRDPASTSTLPVQVELHRRTASGWVFAQRFEPPCPDLHGSYTNARHTAFGCSDGVLVVTRSGSGASATFSARKIANPDDMPTGARIGTVKGHDKVAQFVGLASPGHLFAIDPDAGRITRVNWAEGRTVRAHGFDRAGQNYAVLDDQGSLHLTTPANGFATRAKAAVVAQMPTAAPFPSLVASLSRDELYVSDPTARQVAVVDVPGATVRKRMDMGFAPTGLAWLGIAP
ncbi:hypothetical protein [Acidovorax sp.]|uniref:hypothetical protein n=1 Tax=Acidovorax sp. TaxID=1872122 RepID=UPI00391C0FA9